jgi:hypothetical protein
VDEPLNEDVIVRLSPLLVIAVFVANALFFQARANRLSSQMPEKRAGYEKIIRAFLIYVGGLTAAQAVGMALGLIDVFPPEESVMPVAAGWSPFAWAILVASLLILIRFSVWIYRRNGAEFLVAHGEIFNQFPESSTTVKVWWALTLIASTISLLYQLTR